MLPCSQHQEETLAIPTNTWMHVLLSKFLVSVESHGEERNEGTEED